MIRFILFAILFSLPGFVVACFQLRFGLAWAFAGGCLGLLCAMRGVTFSRVTRLTFALLLGRNVPGSGNALAPKAEELSEQESQHNETIMHWLSASDLEDHKTWVVMSGLVFGLIVAGLIGFHDYTSLQSEQPTWLIEPTRQDGFGSLLMVHSIAVVAWAMGITAIVFSEAYRRPVLTLLLVPVVASISMFIVGSDKAVTIIYAFGTLAILMGVFWGYCCDYREPVEQFDPEESDSF